jgi:hypothetical protein
MLGPRCQGVRDLRGSPLSRRRRLLTAFLCALAITGVAGCDGCGDGDDDGPGTPASGSVEVRFGPDYPKGHTFFYVSGNEFFHLPSEPEPVITRVENISRYTLFDVNHVDKNGRSTTIPQLNPGQFETQLFAISPRMLVRGPAPFTGARSWTASAERRVLLDYSGCKIVNGQESCDQTPPVVLEVAWELP